MLKGSSRSTNPSMRPSLTSVRRAGHPDPEIACRRARSAAFRYPVVHSPLAPHVLSAPPTGVPEEAWVLRALGGLAEGGAEWDGDLWASAGAPAGSTAPGRAAVRGMATGT